MSETDNQFVGARVHVILARDTPTAIIIRRGPSKHVCTLAWDRRLDTFQLGQWLKGRIYERRSDLSPDGKHFLYFAMKGGSRGECLWSWTALSCAPYLKAIGLWAKGDCWFGGGLFSNNNTFWLSESEYDREIRRPANLRRTKDRPVQLRFGGECADVYYPRLLRDGWRRLEDRQLSRRKSVRVFERPLMNRWVLRKIAHESGGRLAGRGSYYDEHELAHPVSGRVISCPQWDWADVDRERLVWTEGGSIFAGRMSSDGLVVSRLLYDLNTLSFTEQHAPY